MLLYVNGCSVTAGDELETESTQKYDIDELGIYQKEHAWPQKLADKLGWDVYNDAECGGSNDRILRTTIDYISSLSDTTDLTVIIGWTCLPRYDIYLNECNESYKSKYIPLVLGYPQPESAIVALDQILTMNCYDVEEMYNNYFRCVLYMQLFLEKLDIPYLMFNVYGSHTRTEYDPSLLKFINNDTFLFKNAEKNITHAMHNILEFKGYGFNKRNHPKEAGHEYWANKLYKFLKV